MFFLNKYFFKRNFLNYFLMDLFIELTLVVFLAVLVGIVMKLLRQPLVISYIVTGIIVAISGIVSSQDFVNVLAEVGVALLLFLVGLSLNPHTIRETGKASVITGLGQVLFTSIFGYLVLRLLGFEHTVSLYLALALTFSSTIIISKLLSDKGELGSLHGRIAIGFLIVQDLVVIVALLALSGLGSVSDIVFNFSLLAVLALLSYLFLPRITRFVASSQELLLLFSVGWCLAIAGLFYQVNLSLEAGALAAGMALSLSSYRHQIGARLKPIRDFFLLMFFVMLGAQMDFSNFGELIFPVIVLSLFILIGNPLIVLILMGVMGYAKKVGFKAGLTVAQISEFSLILIALGVGLGHLEQSVLSLVTAVGIITIGLSTYMILYSSQLYHFLEPALRIFEKKKVIHVEEQRNHKVVLFGCSRMGSKLLDTIKKFDSHFLIVEFDPRVVERLEKEDLPIVYGDAQDPALLDQVLHKDVELVISTINHLETNQVLLSEVKSKCSPVISSFVAKTAADALLLYDEGATHVTIPHFESSDHLSELLHKHSFSQEGFSRQREAHKKDLMHYR